MFIPYMNFISGTTPWTPADITTSLWLDASDATTITESAGAVSKWDDKSGNSNDSVQVVSADQPSTGVNTLNSLNVITFASDFLNLTTKLTTIKSAIFVLNNLPGDSVQPVYGNDDSTEHTFIRGDADYDISIDGGGGTGNASIDGGSLVSGGNIILGVSVEGKKLEHIWYADYDSAVSVKHIGQLISGATPFSLIGDIAEIILLDYVPTTEVRQKLEVYLQAKWNTPALP